VREYIKKPETQSSFVSPATQMQTRPFAPPQPQVQRQADKAKISEQLSKLDPRQNLYIPSGPLVTDHQFESTQSMMQRKWEGIIQRRKNGETKSSNPVVTEDPVRAVMRRKWEERTQRQQEKRAAEGLAVQAKLAIGAVGDKYEQEADKVASQVVQTINSPVSVQRHEMHEADEELQMKPAISSIQREAMPEEEEELQMKPAISSIQRETLPEEEEELQTKPLAETIQRDANLEEEEELQMKPLVQRQDTRDGGVASVDLESEIQSARGGGQSLDPSLQAKMGQAMGADFSGVKVHTDSQSDQLNQSIQAKAFTTGQDVFFRQGAYEPTSRGGQELIAHELTHVVQQNGGAMLSKTQANRAGSINENNCLNRKPKIINREEGNIGIQRSITSIAHRGIEVPQIQLVGHKSRRNRQVKRVKSVEYDEDEWTDYQSQDYDDETYEDGGLDPELQAYMSPRNSITLYDMISNIVDPLIEEDERRRNEKEKEEDERRRNEKEKEEDERRRKIFKIALEKYKKPICDIEESIKNLKPLSDNTVWEHEIKNRKNDFIEKVKETKSSGEVTKLKAIKEGIQEMNSFLIEAKTILSEISSSEGKQEWEEKSGKQKWKEEPKLSEERETEDSASDAFADKYPHAIRIKPLDSLKDALKGTIFLDHQKFVTSTFKAQSKNMPKFDGNVIYHDTQGGGGGGFTIFGVIVGDDRFLIAHGGHTKNIGEYFINWCCKDGVTGWEGNNVSYK
jgi:hypothetical protein